MNGYWIMTKEKPAKTALYKFTKNFTLDKIPDSFEIDVCADTRYILCVNGRETAHGPCQSGEEMRFYETADAVKFLKKGENEISVNVLHVAGDEFIAVYGKEKPALWFHGKLRRGGEEDVVISDDTWKCARIDSVSFRRGERVLMSMAPFEDVGKNVIAVPVDIENGYEPHPEKASTNRYGLNEKYILVPRPFAVFTSAKGKKLKELRRYTDGNGKLCVEFDAGAYTTSFVDIKYKAKDGAKIKIVYSECYSFPDGDNKPKKYRRDDTSGELFGVYDSVTASGNVQTFTPFWYRAFRFIKLISDDNGTEAEITHRRYAYPFFETASDGGAGTFACSDKTLEKMWDVSVNTLECSTHEIFVDCPYYEQQQYCMDGALESLYAFRLTNNADMQKKIITDMAQSQQLDGMIQANYPSTHRQIIPGFSLFWVMMNREYLRYTGDAAFVRSMSGIADRVLQGFDDMLTDDGIVGSHPSWMFTDWVAEWNIGVPRGGENGEPLTVYSLMYAAALECQAEVCDGCGRKGLAAEYRKRKALLIKNVNKVCFDKKARMYVDVPGRRDFSRHTAVWAVLSGAVCGDDAGKLIDRAFKDDGVSTCSFSMNYYTFRALEKAGKYDEYAEELFGGWRHMLDMHCTTWCENPGQPRSECHGWSSVPIFEFSERLLGVYPEENGYGTVRIAPHTFGLERASGRIPVPNGYVDVSFEKLNENYILHVASSKKRAIHIVLPDKKEIYTDERDVTLEFRV